MLSSIVRTKPKTISHMIVRDRNNYFYNRFENNRPVGNARPVTSEFAQAIYHAHETAVQSGHISFASDAPSWSWTSEKVGEGENARKNQDHHLSMPPLERPPVYR